MLAIARTFVVLEAVHATDAGPWRVVVAADDLYPQLPVGEDLHAGDGLVAIVHLRLHSGSHRHQSSRMMLAGSNLAGATSEGEENGTDGRSWEHRIAVGIETPITRDRCANRYSYY